MKITLLCENGVCGMRWRAEWGFSAFIEFQGTNILFDTGYSDVYRFNADLAGIDLETADFLALSHIHRDHTRGLLHHRFEAKKPVLCHPRVLADAPDMDDEAENADYARIQEILRTEFEPRALTTATEFVPGAYFLGEIPRTNGFERGAYFDDPMPDDTALAFRSDKGAIVVAGCSHAGICNICDHAKHVTGQDLYAVIGGFHLLHDEEPPVEETIAYFRRQNPEILLPMHCVEFDILARFHAELGTVKYAAGDVIDL